LQRERYAPASQCCSKSRRQQRTDLITGRWTQAVIDLLVSCDAPASVARRKLLDVGVR
jgi:hypothetical protein